MLRDFQYSVFQITSINFTHGHFYIITYIWLFSVALTVLIDKAVFE